MSNVENQAYSYNGVRYLRYVFPQISPQEVYLAITAMSRLGGGLQSLIVLLLLF